MAEDHAVRFARIARDLAAQRSEQAVLERVVELAVQELDGCDDAGIMLLRRKQEVETAATSSDLVERSDEAQARNREGPCFDAARNTIPWHNAVYRIDDTATEDRWPAYVPEARELGVGAMLGFQLYREEESFGALDLYAKRPHAFDDGSERLGWVLASHAAVALNSVRTSDQLHSALQTRQEIGKALGRVMERYGISDDMAFAVLQRASQDNNIKLHTVADEVVRTGHIPGV